MPERLPGLVLAGALWVPLAAGCRFPGRPSPLPLHSTASGLEAGRTAGQDGVEEKAAEKVERSPDPPLDPQRERLLTQAEVVLDAIASRSLADAVREVNRLRELFPGDGQAELIEVLLRRRLERLKSRSATRPYGNPAAAKQELARALALERGRQLVEAHQALERAHVFDPASLEIEEELVRILKKLGLELYGKGDLTLAVSFWRRVIEIRPGDPEAHRFIQRAEEVLRKG